MTTNYLLLGAGFTKNWGGPLANEVAGNLLTELRDDPVIADALRNKPFEEAFADFGAGPAQGAAGDRHRRLQGAIVGYFDRINRNLSTVEFEFSNQRQFSVKDFLLKFDAIFSLNQDLLLETHYMDSIVSGGTVLPGMVGTPPAEWKPPLDKTGWIWEPGGDTRVDPRFQPIYKLHGSSNWQTDSGERVLIMGNQKAGAIERFPILRDYHDAFSTRLNEGDAQLMVIGYGFIDEHINNVIETAWRSNDLQTFIVDPEGRNVLVRPEDRDPSKTRIRRSIEKLKFFGEIKRPISSVFSGHDPFGFGELMKFFG
jgi:SIR2-like domain